MRAIISVFITVVGLFIVLVGAMVFWRLGLRYEGGVWREEVTNNFEFGDVAQPPSAVRNHAPQPGAAVPHENSPQRPDWVDAPPHSVGDGYRMSVAVGPYTTRAECDAQLPASLQEASNIYAKVCLAGESHESIILPIEYLKSLVKDKWEEVRQHSVGPMTTLHVLVEFDRKAKDRVLAEHRGAKLSGRLWYAGLAWFGWLALLGCAYACLKTIGTGQPFAGDRPQRR